MQYTSRGKGNSGTKGKANNWHFVTITNPSGDGEHWDWTNRAGVVWPMTVDSRDCNGNIVAFDMDPKNPYYKIANFTEALVGYKKNGMIRRIEGPWDEPYRHVEEFTTMKDFSA